MFANLILFCLLYCLACKKQLKAVWLEDYSLFLQVGKAFRIQFSTL